MPDGDVVITCSKRNQALRDVDPSTGSTCVERWRIVGYLGPNGAGKSTTIQILLDLARPDSGEDTVLGEDRALPGLTCAGASATSGELRLDERMRVDETLHSWAGCRAARSTAPTYSSCATGWTSTPADTRRLSSSTPAQGGPRRCLHGPAGALVLDEPTAGVDPLVQAEFRLVAEVTARPRCSLVSCAERGPAALCDKVIVLAQGV